VADAGGHGGDPGAFAASRAKMPTRARSPGGWFVPSLCRLFVLGAVNKPRPGATDGRGFIDCEFCASREAFDSGARHRSNELAVMKSPAAGINQRPGLSQNDA
jgi:hypothetical protein